MDQNAILIFLALSILGGLASLGLLIFALRMWNHERAAKQRAAAGLPPLPDPPPPAELPTTPNPAENLKALAQSWHKPAAQTVTVERDPRTGQVSIVFGGKRFARFEALPGPFLTQELLTLVNDLQTFVGQPASAPPAEAAPPAPASADPGTGPVIYRAAELPPVELPSMQPFKQIQKAREIARKPQPVLKSITEQIDDHLQSTIAPTPLARRGLHVRAGPQGAAFFLVDGKSYEAVEAIPDPEVQQAIRAAIAEWEKNPL